MKKLNIKNPFNAPVYYKEFAGSTMDISKELALRGEPCGTVITVDYQERGRGRIENRNWEANKGESLLFSIRLDFPDFSKFPEAITLRTGLALAGAIEVFSPAMKNIIKIKWPNDIMIPESSTGGCIYKKAAGILTVADNQNIHIGIGVNMMQKNFSDPLKGKTTSIAMSHGMDIKDADRFLLLGIILEYLYKELNFSENNINWKERIEKRLYKNGENAIFLAGPANGVSEKILKGTIKGIGSAGELLISPEGKNIVYSFTAGELAI